MLVDLSRRGEARIVQGHSVNEEEPEEIVEEP